MMIYLACSIMPLVAGLALPQINQRGTWKIGYLACVFTLLGLILGLRGEGVGIDTESYSRYYGYLADRDDFMSIVNSAPVYSIVSRLLYFICTDPQIILIVQAAVTCAATAYFIFVFSRRVEFSTFLFVALYFYENAFNGARQICAAALCCAAIAFVHRGHRAASIVSLLCALGIHVISVVMVPFVALAWYRGTPKRFCAFVVAALAMVALTAIALRPALHVVTYVLPGYRKYIALIDDPAYLTQGRNVLQGLFFCAISVVSCAILWRGLKADRDRDDVRYDPATCSVSLAALFGSLWSTAFFWNAFLGPRIAWFPTLALITVIPDVLERCRGLSEGIARSKHEGISRLGPVVERAVPAAVMLACLALQVIQLAGNYSGVIPYYPFWMD